jgi:ubiquinone/menaquinone biosynthesis C-methylase UbiE
MPESLGAFDPTTTYDEAVTEYEDASSEFWRYLSDHAVELLALRAGERVLDVPCGTGHSVFPAAERVGPSGRVVALDISERMVAFVHEKAARHEIGNIEVAVADMVHLGRPDVPFDAVLCILGIFFVPDMPAALRGLTTQVRPGGRVALAVFGESFYEPLRTTFVEAVHDVAPALEVAEPWSRLRTEADLRDLFEAAGLDGAVISERVDQLPLDSADDWWRIVMGSALRHTISQLTPAAAEHVRARCNAEVARRQITALTTISRYGLASPRCSPPQC